MCGIVGYIGGRQAAPILLDGLQKLEYRGYDSAGIAVLGDNVIKLQKKTGKLIGLRAQMNESMPTSTVGIGHTRWATHGRPSDANAHPHLDCSGRFAVVHNGIIENYLNLREQLISQGHVFRSETDTEVLPHLIEELYTGDLVETMQRVLEKVDGSYAAVVLSLDEPDQLLAARHDSPLVVGLGEGENFLASDIPALLAHTRRTYILEDGEIAVLTRDRVQVLGRNGQPVEKQIYTVKWEAKQAEKDGYAHFMLKEIHEQPRAIKDTLSGRIAAGDSGVTLKEINIPEEQLREMNKIFITACGTAYHAGLVGKHIIESLARIPVEVDIASEFRYRNPLLDRNSLVIVVSQSGETADTLAALREAKRKGARVLAVTNVVDSSVAREADDVLYTWAGPEIAVASTKAYTTQLVCMYLIGLYLAQQRGALGPGETAEIVAELRKLPGKVSAVLENGSDIENFVRQYSNCGSVFYIGRGLDHAVAMEGSLKLKEISYIHAEAYAAGELKHGTLALIEKDVPVIALATQADLFEKMLSNIKEVKARDAVVVAVAMRGLEEVAKEADQVMYIPRTHQVLAPVLAVIPLQLLAYHMAVARNCDVDQPRNLAKSVTVE
ncbi:glutamine--fructose-6-phosphate transaminase (isomerizing) [Desulfallas thermosapovorans]|uniref:Glutamine--fructose-6-phosphate aminotransferase [isomerizing] n=1 Tax=Desulfallas thermosapovorans DSM 6562 TaxID=1121431 RepID=A0A5S4ZPD0_9FIRM|nr:glutamine--fructose-6-phosphate transaminase (isomerizing) [Desulfallas thermosapovorans]TYO94470.1 glucosamine--fructose-6-phosphate aminotransferase (isomerizing) [Desulfallas thermosapovorans DSM 6562]